MITYESVLNDVIIYTHIYISLVGKMMQHPPKITPKDLRHDNLFYNSFSYNKI